MNEYLDNFYRLFSENDQEVYKAVLEKKDWILIPLFLPGDLSISKDEEGKNHFFALEALFNDVLLFKSLDDKRVSNFRYVKFKKRITGNTHPHFYVEYDFNKIDQKGYQTVVANFYHCLNKKELEINKNSDDIKELLKLFMIGEENEAVIVLEESNLLNNAFFAPIMKRVIVSESAPMEVKEVLIKLAEEKNIGYAEKSFVK